MKVKNAKFTGQDAELQIHETKETWKNSNYEVKLTVRNTKPNASQDYSWANSVPQRIEVYDAKGIQQDEYFQGHYLRSVTGVEKKVETVEVPEGWYYVSTAQAKGRLVTYLLEPETDDNLITWGYTDNVLRVTPENVAAAVAEMLGDTDPSSLTPEQRTQVESRARAMMERTQRVPMMRVMTEQPKSLLEVVRFGDDNRTRYWRP